MAGNNTLALAETRSALGDSKTHYLRDPAALDKTITGAADANTFWCSGLSMWTLAAAGYDLSEPIYGKDGKPYSYTEGPEKNPRETNVTLKMLIDGQPEAVEAMAMVEQKGMTNGGTVGRVTGAGHTLGQEAGKPDAMSVKGAAGAFELTGLGAEVDESEQKPGDFAQAHWMSLNDAGVKDYWGAGHAWQVWSTRVKGSALFGERGSPKAVSGDLEGWHDDVEFVLDKDTEPSRVGAHTTLKATRIEANIPGASGLANKKAGGDGGVANVGVFAVPDMGGKYEGYKSYFGRLGTNTWASWQPTPSPVEVAESPASVPAQEAEAPEESSWTSWLTG